MAQDTPKRLTEGRAKISGRTIEPDFNFINAKQDSGEKAYEEISRKAGESDPFILVVDDNPPVLKMLETALRYEGLEPLIAIDGNEAITLFKKYSARIPVVVLDECLPDTSGQELIEKIHKLSPQTKLILTSGHYGDDFSTPVLDRRYATFLHKPYSIEKLMQLIRGYIEKSRENSRNVNSL